MEGTRAVIGELFRRLVKDKRHTDIFVIEEGWIEHREFAAWTMAYVGGPGGREIPIGGRGLAGILESKSGRGRALVEMMRYLLQDECLP